MMLISALKLRPIMPGERIQSAGAAMITDIFRRKPVRRGI
jgi:hypothetical protein